MNVVRANNVGVVVGSWPVLEHLDFEVNDGDRIGVIGPNGAGKSTLLRVLNGTQKPDSGEVTRRRGSTGTYLPQHAEGDNRTPIETVVAARPEIAALEAELKVAEAQVADPAVGTDMGRLSRALARQEEVLERWVQTGGSGVQGQARSLLLRLGIEEAELTRPTADLSGGTRKLVALAACVIQQPDVLLLDEPETHIDAARRVLLERMITEFDGAVVVVSHDRHLLDETVSEIAELDGAAIKLWPGNYSAYAVARELALQRQQRQYVTQQKEIARLEEAVRRFKQWAHQVVDERHIRQARNKQRQIDRMEKIDRPVLERRKMALQLRSALRGGTKIVEITDVSIAFDDKPVLLGVDVLIHRGERVGIVGPNGAGKSVLGRVLFGGLTPTEGTRWAGPSIRFGYLAQDLGGLDLSATPVDLVRAQRAMYEEEAVKLLGRFLFRYDQMRRPLSKLSGGERIRVAFLLLMLSGANCLVLDEPTNHLDIDSLEVLENAIEHFDGTVVVISHDRYFLERIPDRILEVSDGEVRELGTSEALSSQAGS